MLSPTYRALNLNSTQAVEDYEHVHGDSDLSHLNNISTEIENTLSSIEDGIDNFFDCTIWG